MVYNGFHSIYIYIYADSSKAISAFHNRSYASFFVFLSDLSRDSMYLFACLSLFKRHF